MKGRERIDVIVDKDSINKAGKKGEKPVGLGFKTQDKRNFGEGR